ncbi:MAG: nucleotidyltransferase [Bacteriovoracaceae bacterium]|nr:nucleotidyltransferase [Bacteriovoracaceae bacterium]
MGSLNGWEDIFKSWAQPPSNTEDQKCENAERMIKEAIRAYPPLNSHDVSTFAQGSYKANTNIRFNSDVDICIRHNDIFFDEYTSGVTQATVGNIPSILTFSEFKNLVKEALVAKFGSNDITKGDKSIKIKGNTYRIGSDVVPTFEYRWYLGGTNYDGSHRYFSGTKFISESCKHIVNWPVQTYQKGVEKNNATSRRFKSIVRIIKKLRDRMQEKNILMANDISSFLIESLVYNVPDDLFGNALVVV